MNLARDYPIKIVRMSFVHFTEVGDILEHPLPHEVVITRRAQLGGVVLVRV